MAKNMKPELFRDSFQNWKTYAIPKAQLILTDVPYLLGKNAYASNPAWYNDGDKRTAKASWQVSSSFHQIASFDQRSLCTSVPRCSSKSQRRQEKHRV